MTFEEYSDGALKTAVYPDIKDDPGLYVALGLNGEAGEVAELVKKAFRDGHAVDRHSLAKELGDVLWYVNAMARDYGLTLEDIAILNIAKLASRKARGVLGGSGNDR